MDRFNQSEDIAQDDFNSYCEILLDKIPKKHFESTAFNEFFDKVIDFYYSQGVDEVAAAKAIVGTYDIAFAMVEESAMSISASFRDVGFPEDVNYTVYGDEWYSHVLKFDCEFIEKIFRVTKKVDETKSEFIKRCRLTVIVRRFNQDYKVGDALKWRPVKDGVSIEVTLKHKAYINHGVAVAFFEEKVGFCCVEPDFVDYK